MSIANEPYVRLLTLIQSQSALLAIVGTRYGQGNGRDMAGFPSLSWNRLMRGLGATDAEHYLYARDRVQFDLFGADPDQLHELALLVDGMNDATSSLDSTSWSCKVFRRDTAWRELIWPGDTNERITASGNPLVQLTSDWRFEYARKQ